MVTVSRSFGRVALLCAVVVVAHAAETQSAARGSKVLTGKVCTKSDSACVKCVKSTSSGKKGHSLDCLACSTGPVDAQLDGGQCICPAGSALTGSKLTVKAAGNGDGSGKKSSSAKSGGKGSGPATCSECGANSFAAESKPVSASRCTKCPTGTTTRGETGSATCYVEPGTYFDPSKPNGQQVIICPADQYCPGGDIVEDGLSHPNCPAGSTTLGTTGNDVIGDCVVPPGSYYNGKDVVKCEVGSYCAGGPIGGAGDVATKCPAGSITAATGSVTISQCLVPPGSYYNGKDVVKCDVGSYCAGGPIGGGGNVATKCPAGSTTTATGSVSISQCIVLPGSFYDGTNVQVCPADNYCPGGPVGGAGNVVNKCPPGTATTSTGSSTISQCLVPPGSYYDGSKLVTCTAGSYCTGGPVDGAGSKQTSCPAGDTSNPGAAALGECFPACAAPNLVCPAGCIDPFTDSKNCGTCGNTCKDANTCFGGTCSCGAAGNVCPAGATCKPFGTTQTPTCICDAFAQPVFVPEPLAIGQKVLVDNLVKAFEIDVVPGNEYSLTYNSFQIPDRFVVTDGIICGRPIVDTGFTGLTSAGCAASSPCCRAGEFPGCTGNSGQVCPSDPEAVPQPGGGAGVGTTAPFVATTNKLYVIGFGVCAGTAFELTLNNYIP